MSLEKQAGLVMKGLQDCVKRFGLGTVGNLWKVLSGGVTGHVYIFLDTLIWLQWK